MEEKVVGFNPVKIPLWSLRCRHSTKVSNQVVFRSLFQSRELVTIGVVKMLKIERTRYAVLEILHYLMLIAIWVQDDSSYIPELSDW
jgi:hypothetical protein